MSDQTVVLDFKKLYSIIRVSRCRAWLLVYLVNPPRGLFCASRLRTTGWIWHMEKLNYFQWNHMCTHAYPCLGILLFSRGFQVPCASGRASILMWKNCQKISLLLIRISALWEMSKYLTRKCVLHLALKWR